MNEWLSRTQLRQRPMLAVYAGVLILIALVIGIAALLWLSSPSSDRLAVIANLLALGTLLLALVAGIIALAAYSAATGLPNLRLIFNTPQTFPGEILILTGDPESASAGLTAASGDDNIARITVWNTTKYAARTPAVAIEFQGAVIRQDMYAASNGWIATARDFRTKDVLRVQWDGGPNYAIHGDSTRQLPELNLQGLYLSPNRKGADMVVRLLADGYSRQEIKLTTRFIPKSERSMFIRQRAGLPMDLWPGEEVVSITSDWL